MLRDTFRYFTSYATQFFSTPVQAYQNKNSWGLLYNILYCITYSVGEKYNICYYMLLLIQQETIRTKGASPQGSIQHQLVSESWNFTDWVQMGALREKYF